MDSQTPRERNDSAGFIEAAEDESPSEGSPTGPANAEGNNRGKADGN